MVYGVSIEYEVPGSSKKPRAIEIKQEEYDDAI